MSASLIPDPSRRISLRGLSKFYGDFLALDRLSLDIDRGEKIVVIGPSGSGKSTFLRCFNRIEPHDSGVLMIDGRIVDDRTDLTLLRASVGIVFQNYNLFPHLSVLDNCTLAPRFVAHTPRAEAESAAHAILARVGIAEQAMTYPIQLSVRQQQRVAIARALCMNPEIILFDEPTAALDPEAISGIVAIVDDLAADGITTICVTHEMGFARRIADRVVFMDRGASLEIAPPERFFQSPDSERARAFLSQMIRF